MSMDFTFKPIQEVVKRLLAALLRSGLAIKRPDYFCKTADFLGSLGANVDLRALPYHRQGDEANFWRLGRTNWQEFSGQVEHEVRDLCSQMRGNVLLAGHCFGALTLLVVALRMLAAGEQEKLGGFIGMSIPYRLHWWGRMLLRLSRLLKWRILYPLRFLPIRNPFSDSGKISKWLPANAGLLVYDALAELEALLAAQGEHTKWAFPILLVHGKKDTIAKYQGSIVLHRCLREITTPAGLALFPNEGHDMMSDGGDPATFGDTDYEWIIRHWVQNETRLAYLRIVNIEK